MAEFSSRSIGEREILYARLDDLCNGAVKGVMGSSCFLSPRDLHYAREYISRTHANVGFIEWGGYGDAERKKIFLLPEYMEGVESYSQLVEYGFEDELGALEIIGSGYKKLSHRDFLGSVLGLGLERSVIGDIFLSEGEDSRVRATLICERKIAPFICDTLIKVASDTVRTKIIELCDIEPPERRFVHISDTVASARLDCVVSSLLSLSREKAKSAVEAGLCEVDHETCERADRMLTAPCTVSVRGYGRFRVNSLSDKTKKGRLRLDADKYV